MQAVFLPAPARQASETVSVLNSDKATRRTITNYVIKKSKERKLTPYNQQEKKRRQIVYCIKQQCIF